MTLEQIRILAAVVECGSLKKAAEQLHKTQPALSMAMQKLEAELGFLLLDRQHYRLSLTPHGAIFFRQARTLLTEANQLQVLGKSLAKGYEAKYRICYDEGCVNTEVDACLSTLFNHYPSTEFLINSGSRFNAINQVKEQSVELGIGPWFHIFQATGQYESFPIGELALVLVASEALFQPDKVNYSADLKKYSCITLKESNFEFDSEQLNIVQGSQLIKTDDLAMLSRLVISGAGWAMMSRNSCQHLIDSGRVFEINLNDYVETIKVEIRVFRKKQREHGPVANKIWALLQNLNQAQSFDS
ncbi:LysR family transcriptional regulator [Pseudoalteromonas tunicata]|jgi:DNA-binding transcriptional LysR family regulator|uniref:Putative Transcriptional regulator, LysR family protein n=1 Tax=Pseudoalteromonas tunicata D2 TaxID=87626 RepID=A4C497_9GAMM|nr:LysR family transcriptional regulator [Pseudoalteromonas tunicata]ATC97139.1 hypothetical protein PTUN_b0806 [Pseudoalteromonas tunicata]AXT33245.1 LysR family transcriptional regulator [Pseudoalteromonas tunicata]EAR30379.1 putative Transcriptional regulator, LysR family protein [Pseudoalteromonas tunicata D2]MDP4984778.1 LysR family transcriptional regulator [Pseudoalteromonas tunicata]